VKIILCVSLGSLLFTVCFSAAAAQPNKVPRIGFLSTQSASRSAERADAFRQGLRELGYAEGRNILIEYRWADGISDRLPGLAEEFVRLKVDVIVTSGGNQAIRAAKNATTIIPIVFNGGGDVVAAGIAASFSHPGGNMTGVTLGGPELSGKRIEILKEVIPKATRVAIMFNPTNLGTELVMKESSAAAQGLGLQVQFLEVRQANEIESAFDAAIKARINALCVQQNPPISSDLTRVVTLAAKRRLAAIYVDKNWPDAGGLMSYGTSITEVHRRAAVYVDKILKGANPAELPVERPTKFEFVVNLKAAKQIGLTIPPNVLVRADRVIR
jgi:putative ABC transport system substrate-binding protein